MPPKGVVLTGGGGVYPHMGWLYPSNVVVLSPKRGGFIPHKNGHKTTQGGFKGGFIPHLGVVLCPGPGTYDPKPASKYMSTIYFMWQSMKVTSVACIRSQPTTGSRCGTDQGSVVETRRTTELKVVAPGLLENI